MKHTFEPMQAEEQQLEFEAILEWMGPLLTERTKERRRPRPVIPRDKLPVVLLRATFEENLAFTTYAIMLAVSRHGERHPSLASIAVECGYSYWGVRNQVDRTPWFDKLPGQVVRLKLKPEAEVKLARIEKRIARYE